MSAPRSLATKRARAEARRRDASAARRRGLGRRASWWGLWFSSWVATYVTLLGAGLVDEAAWAVVASVLACAWAVAWCGLAATWDRFPALEDAWGVGRWNAARERVYFLVLQLGLVSPVATHWMVGRTRVGHLEFTDAATSQAAQVIGWVAFGIVAVGGPLAWAVARLCRASG